jgi:hypothetical protein
VEKKVEEDGLCEVVSRQLGCRKEFKEMEMGWKQIDACRLLDDTDCCWVWLMVHKMVKKKADRTRN